MQLKKIQTKNSIYEASWEIMAIAEERKWKERLRSVSFLIDTNNFHCKIYF